MKEKIKQWLAKIGLKLALKGFSKGCEKLIVKGVKLDLNKDDINDLQEWKNWCDKAIEAQK